MVKTLHELYKCSVCGNIVQVEHVGGGVLVCCGKEMVLQEENSVDASKEKHVPVIEVEGTIARIKVGSEPHPMEESHFIMWIELLVDGVNYIKHLNPGEAPEAEFIIPIGAEKEKITARCYCNLHGHWKAER